MNRFTKRKQAKEKKITLTPDQVRRISENHINRETDALILATMKASVRDLFSACILTLHDKEGFGKKRLNRFLENVNETFVDIGNGLITIDDVKKECEDIGIIYERVLG